MARRIRSNKKKNDDMNMSFNELEAAKEEKRYKRYMFDRIENDRRFECQKQGKTYVDGHMNDDGTYVHGHCREMTASERADENERIESLRKMMSKYPSKPKIKSINSLGGGDEVVVYEPMNPLEAVIGGKVVFRKTKRNRVKKNGKKIK